MRYLLDTNACIRYLNGRSESLRQQIISKNPNDIALCSVVKAELFMEQGQVRIRNGVYKNNRYSLIVSFPSLLTIKQQRKGQSHSG